MRRAFAATLVLIGLVVATPAHAETDLAILGPIGTGDVAGVKAALGKVKGTLGAKAIDATCAGDPGCLTTTGRELGAHRVLSVVVNGSKLTLTLVDVSANTLLGIRDIDLPKKVAKDLPPMVGKFVDDTIVDKAKALFAEGNQHYNLGEFTQALDKYKLAYRVKPLPAFQFNIAQCHRKLGQNKEAIAMYQAYLVDVPDAPNKAMVDSLIEESKKALAEQTAADSAHERERLATERKKAEEARKIKEAEAAAKAETAKAEQARIAAERERDKSYNRHPARTFMLVTGALGLATIGAGAYFGVQARNAQRSFDDAGCGDPTMLLGQAALATCMDDRDRGQKNAFLSNVLLGSGGAVLLTSALVFIIDPGNVERPNGPRVSITPSSVKVVFAW
jgi:hypothetical protein